MGRPNPRRILILFIIRFLPSLSQRQSEPQNIRSKSLLSVPGKPLESHKYLSAFEPISGLDIDDAIANGGSIRPCFQLKSKDKNGENTHEQESQVLEVDKEAKDKFRWEWMQETVTIEVKISSGET